MAQESKHCPISTECLWQGDSPTSSEPELSIHPHRERRPPLHLRDYVCHAIEAHTPDPTPLHAASSNTPHSLTHFIAYDRFSGAHRGYLAAITARDEPHHFSHATQDPRWHETMATEISTLEANNTWELQPLPPSKKALGCKWVYKIKYHANGIVERFKARLVTIGNHQVDRDDYHETFAPIAKMPTVRIFFDPCCYQRLESSSDGCA